jgi:RNA polymerase sigma-70 factor (ECF subfamily)
MTARPAWELERYRPLLKLQTRQMELDPRLQRRFDGSDVVQEALLKAPVKLDQFRGRTEAELVQWLYEILASTLVDEVRKAHRRKRDLALERSLVAAVGESSARLEAYLADQNPTPATRAERQDVLVRVARALEQLPEDQRDVVLLRDVQGHAVAEIAARLARTEKSVAGLLLRGRARLRQLLQDLG